MAGPSGRAGWRLSFAQGHLRRMKRPSWVAQSRGGKPARQRFAFSRTLAMPRPALPRPGSSSWAHAGHSTQDIAGKTPPLPQVLPSQPAGPLALGGGWAVCKHLGEEKMQPPAIDPRASCASQLHPITARLTVFALIKAPAPGAVSILKTKVLCTLRKNLKIYLVEDKTPETER